MQHDDGVDLPGRVSRIPLPLDQAEPARIRFGPKPHQELSPDVASMMLTLWRERTPAHFGAVLAEAMTGEPPRTGRRRS